MTTLKDYLESETPPTGFWHNFPKYVVSLLRAWYGEHATQDNQWGFQWIPRIVGDHSQLPMTLAIADGVIRGLFVLGQNPVIGGSNSAMIQRGFANLDWLVVRDFTETETASFWYAGKPVKTGELRPQDIKTEVFLMPAALVGEKDGTFTNTHRLVQWHDKVVEPPGDSRSETWFVYHLGRRLKQLYAHSAAEKDAPVRALTWDYPTTGEIEEPSVEAVLKEMNGYTWPDRRQLGDVHEIKDDGATACGVWTYTGVFPREGDNRARSRRPDGPDGPGTHLGWGFAWPSNRRTLYNRAAADPEGRPWSERKKLVWWDPGKRRWEGTDVVDFEPEKPPDYKPDWSTRPEGMAAIDGSLAVHDDRRRQEFAVRAVGAQGRAIADPLRAGRIAGAQSVLRPAGEPGGENLETAGQYLSPGRRPALSLCADDLPPDRAPCRRHADPVGRGHRRIAARGVCRNRSRNSPAPSASASSTGSCCPLCEGRSRPRH